MSNKRLKNSISIKVWPFGKDDIAKLYWIDHPYKDFSGNWKMALYFKRLPDNLIRRCEVDWGTLPILCIGRLFKAGKLLLNEKDIPLQYQKFYSSSETTFTFKKQKFDCITGEYVITTSDGFKHTVVRNAFVSQVGGTSIHIPVLEVIRAMLAKSRRLIYSILQPNSMDHYYLVNIDPKNPKHVYMNFTKEYPTDLMTRNHIRHLLWLSTDKLAKNSWNGVYKSILDPCIIGILIDFPYLNNYEIKVRYRQDGNVMRVEEILSTKSQALGFQWIEYTSPYFRNHADSSSSGKKKKVIRIDDNDDVIINSDVSGSKSTEKIINVPVSEHVFNDNSVITRMPSGNKNTSMDATKGTKKVVINTKGPVSAADVGGSQTVTGVEFKEPDYPMDKLDGDIGIFLAVLKAMIERYKDIKVAYSVGNLPEGSKDRKFCKLEDGITPRKYAFAEIIFADRSRVYLIEIERNGKALSTIALINNNSNDEVLDRVLNEILVGLVDNNGVWDNDTLNTFEKSGIKNQRFHHTNMERKIWELADGLYEKLINVSV